MIKTWQSRNNSQRKTIRNNKSHRFITVFCDRKKGNFFRSRLQNHIRFSNLDHDIVLSPSGQVKIDSLASCQTLSGCDFIVF